MVYRWLTPRTRVFEKLAKAAQLSGNSSPFISLKLINMTTGLCTALAWIQFITSQLTSLRSMLIISCHLHLYVTIFFGCFSWVGFTHIMTLFDSGVMKTTFGPKRADVRGAWRKLHIDELQYMYSTPNTIGVTESKKMRQAEHVARLGKSKRL